MAKKSVTRESSALLKKLEKRVTDARIEEVQKTGDLSLLFGIKEEDPERVDKIYNHVGQRKIVKIFKTIVTVSILSYILMALLPLSTVTTILITASMVASIIISFQKTHLAAKGSNDKSKHEIAIYSIGIFNLIVLAFYTFYFMASGFALYIEANQPALKSLLLFLTQGTSSN
jgi:hypothetical protein